jgi:hypothetical protein
MLPAKNMFKINFKKTILSVIVFGILAIAPAVLAEGVLPAEHGTGETACASPNGCGNYSLNDIITFGVNVSQWILGIVGSVALLFFVYGGFVFILSGGNEERVKLGKKILIGSVIGLAIVFTSYLIIQFSMSLLGAKGAGGTNGLTDFFNSWVKK